MDSGDLAIRIGGLNVLKSVDCTSFEIFAPLCSCYASDHFGIICQGDDEDVMRPSLFWETAVLERHTPITRSETLCFSNDSISDWGLHVGSLSVVNPAGGQDRSKDWRERIIAYFARWLTGKPCTEPLVSLARFGTQLDHFTRWSYASVQGLCCLCLLYNVCVHVYTLILKDVHSSFSPLRWQQTYQQHLLLMPLLKGVPYWNIDHGHKQSTARNRK